MTIIIINSTRSSYNCEEGSERKTRTKLISYISKMRENRKKSSICSIFVMKLHHHHRHWPGRQQTFTFLGYMKKFSWWYWGRRRLCANGNKFIAAISKRLVEWEGNLQFILICKHPVGNNFFYLSCQFLKSNLFSFVIEHHLEIKHHDD